LAAFLRYLDWRYRFAIAIDQGGTMGKLILGIIIGAVLVIWAMISILGWIF
jgi:hypothetical protein